MVLNSTELGSSQCRKFQCIKTLLANYLLGGVYFETTNGTPALKNHYEIQFANSFAFSSTNNTNISGSAVLSGLLSKDGNRCTLSVNSTPAISITTSATAGSSFVSTAASALPARFRPTYQTYFPCVLTDNSTRAVGVVSIAPDGTMIFQFANGTSNFTASNTVTVAPFSITWTVSS